ncbi:heavy metal sensor histidine kinase [Pseudomonas sp. KFB-139]|uniref:Sensor protein n=1 Tax=Pseudomonas serbiensis TaxID=3064350 RepID=A0ABT9CL06_9PSED|nr:heavy metal sensor histidine kinase [Pseudomonas sp. KFB-138]MDO7926158.1 heavy metal sensor histidine kinase [Pseudomonas sp. KFB-138]
MTMRLSFDRLSLRSRLALLFAACTAVVSLTAGIVFNHASATHFVELDQQLLDARLANLRGTLHGAETLEAFTQRKEHLLADLNHQPDLTVRISGSDGQTWFDNTPPSSQAPPQSSGLHTLHSDQASYRSFTAKLQPGSTHSPQVTLLLDITHHQHFLQRMQHLIWLTVGLSALATALLGAWATRSGLKPLHRMSAVAAGVSASSLTTRLPEANMPRELAELTRAFNAMLARLDDGFQRLSAFSADIAHELRTPLSNLLTHTQVTLTRTRSLEDYRDALAGNLEELQGMAQMVNDMLFLAKAEHGLLIPARERLALEDEVDAVLEFFAALAEDKNINLSRQGHANVTGDRTMLRRVLSNLLDNALRFTHSGGYIRIDLHESPTGIALSVENNGICIEPDALPRLFDRFYRADPARQESSEHVGLGLAISQSIIRAHGGSIKCESAEGITRFRVEFNSHTVGANSFAKMAIRE